MFLNLSLAKIKQYALFLNLYIYFGLMIKTVYNVEFMHKYTSRVPLTILRNQLSPLLLPIEGHYD